MADKQETAHKPSITLPAVVDKIIESPDPKEPEKAQINIQDGADPLYREIRIKNSLTDHNGKKVVLKEGEEVEVTVEAQKPDTAPRNGGKPNQAKTSRAGENEAAESEEEQEDDN
jgi:predicted DNA-binding antitoxin AbrB/MazE fold protein